MSFVTIVYSMIAAACLTLAAVHLPVWWRNRDAPASLAFSIAALCTAAIAGCELTMLTTQSTAVYGAAQRWSNVPIVVLLVALAAFSYHYLAAGRRWLAITGVGLRLVSLVINFSAGQSLNYRQIDELKSLRFMGEQVSFAVGVLNPWQAIGQLGVFMLMLYFADASITAWRRGRRAAAFFVGGALTFFMFASVTRAFLVYWQGVQSPSMVSLFSLGVVLVMGYALSADLLQAKRLVVELGEREHEANLAADAAELGIWTRDVSRDVIRASGKWRDLFGFPPDEKIDLEALLQRIHVDDRGDFRDRLAQAARDRAEYHAEFRLALPDGRMRWIAAMGRVDVDAKGRTMRTRGACIDITARRRAEQEMLRLRQDIAHVGGVSVMGQLASTLAHEINQPLGAILRNAEAAALFMQDPAPDLHEIRAIFEDIRKDDQRAGEVIDRMRALLRRQEVTKSPLHVAQVLGDVRQLLRPDATARQVALELAVSADLPTVHGDRVQIQQVLLNLIINAMDALEGLADRPRSIAVSARPEGAASVEISVADSGRGLEADQLDRVFDPFFTTKAAGIGMGLSISRSIVETHGGRLWAESNLGQGATFRFTLPVAQDALA